MLYLFLHAKIYGKNAQLVRALVPNSLRTYLAKKSNDPTASQKFYTLLFICTLCDTLALLLWHSASNRGLMFETATRISLSTSNFERYFVFVIAMTEKPASHM